VTTSLCAPSFASLVCPSLVFCPSFAPSSCAPCPCVFSALGCPVCLRVGGCAPVCFSCPLYTKERCPTGCRPIVTYHNSIRTDHEDDTIGKTFAFFSVLEYNNWIQENVAALSLTVLLFHTNTLRVKHFL